MAQVNLGNGNLLLTGNDGVLNGAGIALRNDRFYNGLSTSDGSYGAGWSSSLSQVDIGLDVTSTEAKFRGPTGFTATFTKSGTTWKAPNGFNATLTENASSTDQRYTLQYNSSGEKISFSTSGYITKDTDRNNVGSSYTYGTDGRINSILTASGRQYLINWASATDNHIATIVDGAGRTIQYDRNAQGQLSRVTKPGSNFEEYTYDASGRVATAKMTGTDQGDLVFTFGYDTSHKVTSISSALASTPGTELSKTTYTYTSGLTKITDGRGNVTEHTIDSSGKVTAVKDALGRSQSTSYTTNNNVATTTDALGSGSTPGNVTTYSYDQQNNATGVSYPTGAAASATYSQGTSCPGAGSGNPNLPKCSKDDAGNGKSFEYDTAGNVTSTTDTTSGGTGAVTESYTYEKTNRSVCGGFEGQICSSKNGIGGVTSYAYDTSGNLLSVTPPAPMGKTVYEYDSLGRVTKVTDGNGDATSYTYSQRDDVLQTTFAGGATFNAEYYQNGTVHFQRDSTTGTKESFYDGLARLLRVTGPAASTTQSYTYDKVGNVLSYTDAQGKVSYTYDAANQLTQLTEPGGTCTTATPAASSGCVKFEYDKNGAETKRTFPGGASMAMVVDLSGRATRITAKDASGAVVSDIGYTYSAGGGSGKSSDRTNVQTRISYKEVGITAGAITSYGYDSLKRLTSAVEKSGTTTTASWVYAYDKAGNRTAQTRAGSTGTPAGTTSYTYNTANQLTSSTGATATYQYDGAGNQKVNGANGQAATYNSRLAATSIGTSSYSAFGEGNTMTQSRSTSNTTYTDASLGLMSEVSAGTVVAFTRTNDGGPVSSREGASRSYFVGDALGSITGLFSATGSFIGGYSYSPYGELRSATSNTTVTKNTIRYIGSYYDSSVAMYRLGARYYDSGLGRFTQFDPSGQEANPYAYGAGNPTSGADPSGLGYGTLGVEACAVVCLSGSINYDPWSNKWAGSVGVGIGPRADLSANLGGVSGSLSSGVESSVTCGAAYYVGGYGTGSIGTSGSQSYGAGVLGGVGAGCSVNTSRTWVW
ncbi:RHS repeat-associated core domain-containing protein [Frigoribacterium sp. PhB118]|uniref:RHS repeat-associated core domain-containing protein n=1 Tax=Frigoribacterium sp. PhB118 TaxID=2485175 RepID=UPI001315A7E0|nr:RHS repeat-associated core domain-containing protein [Frigoribacterium sp. PhB118]